MKQLLCCLVLLCLTIFTFAAGCDNPLLGVFEFTTTGTPQSGSGLKYCKSLQNGNSCCSASIVDSIQDKANVLAARLLGYVAQRDQVLVDARDHVIPRLQASYQNLKDTYPKFLAQLSDNSSLAMKALKQFLEQEGENDIDIEHENQYFRTFLDKFMLPYEQIFDQVYSNLGTIRDQFKDFQKARSTCAVELLKLQSSAWCLACDPAYASKGVSGTTVAMSDRVCNRLQSACYNYISYTATQGGLLYVNRTSIYIEAYANMVEKLTLGDMSGIYSFIMKIIPGQGGTISPSEIMTLRSSTLPTGCTDGQCPWICNSLFKDGKVDETLALVGGDVFYGISLDRRALIEEDGSSGVQRKLQEMRRVLQGGNWDPDQDEAGVSVTFDDDPGNVGNVNGSWGMNMNLMCLVGMLVTIML